MKKSGNMRRKSLLYKYFLSYLAIGLLLIILFGSAFYYFNIASLDTEVQNQYYSATVQSLNRIDYMLEAMSNTANHFSASELRRELSDRQEGGNADFIFSQLRSYEENFPEPTRIMLYVRGSTQVFMSDGASPYGAFEKMTGADLSMSGFFGTINSSIHSKALRILPGRESENKSPFSTAFIYPVPYMSVIPEMSLVFLFGESSFSEIFENYFGDVERNTFLLDASLQMTYQSEYNAFSDAELKRMTGMKGTGVFTDYLENRTDVVLRAVSDHSGYSLFVTMEESVFFSQVSLMKTIVAMCIIFLVVLTLTLAALLTIRSYRPIRTLIHVAHREEQGASLSHWDEEDGNELKILERHISDTHNRNRELSSLLDRQRVYVTHACIEALLRGKDREADLKLQMQCANITFPYSYFQVLIVIPAGKKAVGEKLQNILMVCESICLENIVIYCSENIMDSQISLIVNSKYAKVNPVPIGQNIAEKIQKDLQTLHIEVSIGIGSIQNSVMDIHSSYVEAMVIAKEYLPNQPGNIMCFEDIPNEDSFNYALSFSEQSLLLQALRQGDKTAALRTLDNMLNRIAETDGSVLITQFLCFDIANTLIKILNQSGGNVRISDLQSLNSYQELETFHAHAKAIVEEICKQNETIIEQKSYQLRSDLICYVNMNYRNTGLSLEQMSAHFDLSPGYLSRFFKQVTGQNFMQYVTQLRMDYVRDKLVNTEDQIQKIVPEAGYLDTPSFVRKFKNAEGLTPGQYRKKAQEHRSSGARV